MSKPFYVKDCAIATIATGESAASIVELKEVLLRIPAASLYFHFWRRHFYSSYAHPELPNDFALWSYLFLGDSVLAERLGIIDPTEFRDLEELRKVVLEVIEQRIDEIEHIVWTSKENKFYFLRFVLVVFGTEFVISHPSELKTVLHQLPPNSIFYHFIDARQRTNGGLDDFSEWLKEALEKSDDLLVKIQHIDHYFLSLTEQRQKLTEIMEEATT